MRTFQSFITIHYNYTSFIQNKQYHEMEKFIFIPEYPMLTKTFLHCTPDIPEAAHAQQSVVRVPLLLHQSKLRFRIVPLVFNNNVHNLLKAFPLNAVGNKTLYPFSHKIKDFHSRSQSV